MKLQFKYQKFQEDAARAVCDAFNGQPYFPSASYLADSGTNEDGEDQTSLYTGFRNHPLVPQLTDEIVLENLRQIQRRNGIQPSPQLEGRYNLTVEMETGVGKTYTYIKTMYELNKRYGWCKFIVVVPSVAIREGVLKSFQITQADFVEEYGKIIRFFVYNSARLTEIDDFACDSAMNVMIINSQAFNSRGKDARRIYMQLDSFRSRKPMDVIAKTNPIVIIDEPQSVEGKATKERLQEFQALFTLRYSATHKEDSRYNMVYRLDAMDAYNKKLVKKIAVKGIATTGTTSTEGYLYLQNVAVSKEPPTALLEMEVKGARGVRKKTFRIKESDGFNLYHQSGGLEQYREGYVVTKIDGRDNSVTFLNGKTIRAGSVQGAVNEGHLRRIQIRETILSHLERERQLHARGIKVLSLFFIDEVAKYRRYDDKGKEQNGEYADMFEEEYNDLVNNLQTSLGGSGYLDYLKEIPAHATHKGYFSIDKNRKTGQERLVDSRTERGTTESGDSEAYDLIMKNKERLLDLSEPVRFLFSHSALREGWDNPNVFQICTLKQSGSEVRKRQEVGRGLRLCVNQEGERMDQELLGKEVHSVNVLTVVANESYESFARALQEEIAQVVADRPRKVTMDLFVDREIQDAQGRKRTVDRDTAQEIYDALYEQGYIRHGELTDKYYEEKGAGGITVAEEVAGCEKSIVDILDSIYNLKLLGPDDARRNNVELCLNRERFERREFRELWERIRRRSAFVVDFDADELVRKSIQALNRDLTVSQIFVHVDQGEMQEIASKAELKAGKSFHRTQNRQARLAAAASAAVKYDLLGKLVEETGLTRACAASILQGMEKIKFDLFKENPEEFLVNAAAIINEQKALIIIEHIQYRGLDTAYDDEIFTEAILKGNLGENALPAKRHIFDHVLYDSENERRFAQMLDASEQVAAYAKLPGTFYISTPVGRYCPDWAIAFCKGEVKHVYFVAETKGAMSSMQLRLIEESKIHCARQHFKAISSEEIVYDVVDSFDRLMEIANR